jgi:hypothetical protein
MNQNHSISEGFFNDFLPRCDGRYLPHRDIFRFITRGLIRLRRTGRHSHLNSQISSSYQASRLQSAFACHSGSRVVRILKQPLNDKRSTSICTLVAASSIIARTTECAIDNAYNSYAAHRWFRSVSASPFPHGMDFGASSVRRTQVPVPNARGTP